MSARRSTQSTKRATTRGFTIIEVMMALTVLAIGMLGIIALQKTTVVSNQEAQQITVANAIARTWIERLQRDAARWTRPSPTWPTSDISSTAWLGGAGGATSPWFRPTVSSLEPTASPAFDLNGSDVAVTDPNGVYCTHLRLRWIYTNQMIRAEVRVFWAKRSLANPSAVPWLTAGICSAASSLDTIGSDDQNFHWVYAVAAIPKATGP
jgi:prepilin-type N-terminal cleavage/methylation domain-containing protein